MTLSSFDLNMSLTVTLPATLTRAYSMPFQVNRPTSGISVYNMVKQLLIIQLDIIGMCERGRSKFTKFISNSRKVLATNPKERQYQKIKNKDLETSDLQVERPLSVQWNIENNNSCFQIQLRDKPLTRTGMHSTISSVYDLLGMAAQFVLKGCLILQWFCQLKVDWDEKVPDNLQNEWIHW